MLIVNGSDDDIQESSIVNGILYRPGVPAPDSPIYRPPHGNISAIHTSYVPKKASIPDGDGEPDKNEHSSGRGTADVVSALTSSFESPTEAMLGSFRLVHAWRKRKASRMYRKLLSRYETNYRGDATDGPLSRLWNCTRIRNNSKSKSKVFADSWILRDFQVGNPELLPTSILKTPSKQSKSRNGTESSIVWCLEVSADAKYLAVGVESGMIFVYETTPTHPLGLFDDRPVGIYRKHTGAVISIRFINHQPGERTKHFVSLAMDKTLNIWALDNSRSIETIRISDWASSISMDPTNSSLLYLGVLDATVQVWSLNTQPGLLSTMLDYIRVPDLVTAIAVSPDGKWVLVGVRSGRVALYVRENLKFVSELNFRNKRRWRSPSKVIGIQWSSDSKSYLATLHDNTFRSVDIENHHNESDKHTIFSGHTAQHLLLCASYLPNDQIITGSEDNCLYVWPNNRDPNDYDKIKVSNDLVTCLTVPSTAFHEFIYGAVRDAVSCGLGGAPCKVKSGNEEFNDIIAIVGTYSGDIKIFVNWTVQKHMGGGDRQKLSTKVDEETTMDDNLKNIIEDRQYNAETSRSKFVPGKAASIRSTRCATLPANLDITQFEL